MSIEPNPQKVILPPAPISEAVSTRSRSLALSLVAFLVPSVSSAGILQSGFCLNVWLRLARSKLGSLWRLR